MKKGDRYLLCSDGLTKHTEDFEFQEILGNGSAEEICKEMIDITLDRGAGDNVTAIVIDIARTERFFTFIASFLPMPISQAPIYS